MIEFLSQIDTQVFLFFNSFHTPALDQFMMLLSHRMVWVPMYIMIFAMVVHRYGLPAGIIVALGVALTVTLADQTCATLIRPFVQRLRPANPDNPISDLVHIVWGYRGKLRIPVVPCGQHIRRGHLPFVCVPPSPSGRSVALCMGRIQLLQPCVSRGALSGRHSCGRCYRCVYGLYRTSDHQSGCNMDFAPPAQIQPRQGTYQLRLGHARVAYEQRVAHMCHRSAYHHRAPVYITVCIFCLIPALL